MEQALEKSQTMEYEVLLGSNNIQQKDWSLCKQLNCLVRLLNTSPPNESFTHN